MLNRVAGLIGLFLMLPGLALAADAPTLNAGNTAWILTATALVLFMTLPGLALFYGGLVRSKNVLSILMACFAIAGGVSVLWLLGLYSLTFSDGGAVQDWIGGISKIAFAGMNRESLQGDIPEGLFAAFQMTFAIITPALIIGAFAERVKFSATLIFCLLWTLAVYVPVAHWVWGGGFLAQRGVIDFAGGITVHITAGMAALVAAVVIGPRHGFPRQPMAPHNLTMTVIGAGMLWVGWFGFNAGSALAANGSASRGLGTGGRDMAVQLDVVQTVGLATVFGHLGWRHTGDPAGFKPYRNPWYGELGALHRLESGLDLGAYVTLREPIGRLGPLGEGTAYVAWRQGRQRWQFHLTRGWQTASPQGAAGLTWRQRF